MKKKNLKFLILALIAIAAFIGLTSATLNARSSYAPEDTVTEIDHKRSQVYVDGTGYKLDDYKKQEHKQAQVKHQKVIEREPDRNAVSSNRPSAQRTPGRGKARKPEKKPEKQKKSKEKDNNEDDDDDDYDEDDGDYNDDDDGEEPVIKIKINLDSKNVFHGKRAKIKVTAVTVEGDRITADNIYVMLNGERLLEDGADTYFGDVLEGKNKLRVTVSDSEGRVNIAVKDFIADTNAAPQVIGKLKVIVTAKALGIDTVVPRRTVKIYEGEQLSDVVHRYFSESSGVSEEDIGNGHYEIGRIQKDGVIDMIPEDVVAELEENGCELPDDRDTLGLNDFGPGSGWMYSVNGTSPNQYMSKMDPVPNSNVEIYYTTSAM